MANRRIVQYWNENDQPTAQKLANAFGFELVNSISSSDLGAFSHLIIVGGQNANPLFKSYADHSDNGEIIFQYVVPSDQGYMRCQYHKWTPFWAPTVEIWAVASYEVYETDKSADYLIAGGKDNNGVPYLKKFRYHIGSEPPPTTPPASQPTNKITMTMVLEALKAGAIPYVVGAAVSVGSVAVDNDKAKKIMLLGGVAAIGVGAYMTIRSLQEQGAF